MKVFISSTVEDLRPEREKAIAIVDRIGQAVAMERFFASNSQPKSVCLERLQECDALVLILGFTYGSIDSDEQISLTEIEYNAAKIFGLPIFAFLKYHQGNWQSQEDNKERSEKLLAFKSRVDIDRYRGSFISPDELATEISLAIQQYVIEHGAIGVRVFSFASPEDFFKPFTDKTKLFNHLHPLVGRKLFLKKLNGFVESKKKITILYGRGGIGKSKILFDFSHEFNAKHRAWKLIFLREGVQLSDDAIREILSKKCIVAVDDAHRRPDLLILLSVAQQNSDRLKIVLSSRPQGLEYIKGALTRGGFDRHDLDDIPEVRDLGSSDLQELAKSVLGKDNLRFLDPLLAVARDSPLVLVIGGRLIAEKKIAPALLQHYSDFRWEVFNGFQDVLLGGVTERLEREVCRDLLSLVSALSPIKPHEDSFQKTVSSFLHMKRSKLIDAIGILESAGVLLRRGYSLRITPDVLSDHILHNACLNPQGEPTGYVNEVFDAFGDTFLGNLLFNLSELDWRITQKGRSADLLDVIWQKIKDQFIRASHFRRTQILKYLERVAYFQPAKTLELVECALQNPRQAIEDTQGWLPREYGHGDVLCSLPPILRGIAFNFEYLPRCCDILWQLGSDDERPKNPYPEHAMRVLCELASYNINKPISVNFAVVDAVENRLKQPDAHEHKHSPLDVLDPLLAKEGESERPEGYGVLLQSFPVNFKTTKPIREKALLLLSKCARHPSTKVILRALRSLVDFLNPPRSLYGRVVSRDEVNRWLPEQMKALKIIDDLVSRTKDPIVHLQVASDLQWLAKLSDQKDLAEKAKSIIEAIPNSFDLRIHRAIWQKYGQDWDGEDFGSYQARVNDELKQVVTIFLASFNDGKNAFDFLNGLLGRFLECGIQVQPSDFMHLLASANPELATEICRLIVSKSSSHLSIHLNWLLSGLREKTLAKAMEIIDMVIKSGIPVLCSSVAYGYAQQRWAQKMGQDEITVIEALLAHSDKEVKRQTAQALGRFPNSLRGEAIRLALDFDINEDKDLADALCRTFNTNPQYGIPPGQLDEEDLEAILSKLVIVKEFTSGLHYVDQFLKYCSSLIPEAIVDFWLKRMDIAEKKNKTPSYEYQPIPHLFFLDGLEAISSNPNYLDQLRRVRDRALYPTSTNRFYLPRLFAAMSSGFSPLCLAVLDEWIESDDVDRITGVGLLVREAPRGFVFSSTDFVSILIEKSYAAGPDCYRSVKSGLFSSAALGGKHGAPGQPMVEDTKLRDQAKEVSSRFQRGSLTQRFYLSLAEYAEEQIRDDLAEDEELFEG